MRIATKQHEYALRRCDGDRSTVVFSEPRETLCVNSAFLQEIKDSNPDLWQEMHHLRQLCESDEPPRSLMRKLVRVLDDLRDRWALQFALEESYGYIVVPAAVSDLEPPAARSQALAARAEAARSQHCELYLRVRDLAEQAEELQFRGVTTDQLNELLIATRAFAVAIRDHEQAEHELIESAYGSVD